jgi:hypothetical protein
MKKFRVQTLLYIITILLVTFFISGCVEVTPPSGGGNAESYGPAPQGDGNLKEMIKDQGQVPATQEQAPDSQGQTKDSPEQSSPETVLPPAENESFIRVTPKEYSQLKQDSPASYLPYNRPVSTDSREFLTIYEILNQTFAKNATAYAYNLVTPPLYIELGFNPKIVTDEQEIYKRTGDKEGTIKFTKTRPSQDAWFEMRVYDTKTNEEILREGYGKTYSLTNKTTAIRRAGSFQFDFMGDYVAADIAMKIPVDSATIDAYTNVSTLIGEEKTRSGLLPAVFLKENELGQGWQTTGDLIHTPVIYSSIFISPSSGSKMTQDISKYPGVQDAVTNYEQTKAANTGESLVSIIAGDEGYGFESIRKTGVVFRQGAYLVQLTSYSVPPVSFDELKRLATLISGRISQS